MVGLKSIAALSLAATAAAHPGHSLEARAVPVGSVITKCTKPGVVALSFDDGPYDYTNELLDILDAAGHKATFFVNGDNYGKIENYKTVLQRMKDTHHQIGSHTWDHKDLATLNDAQIRDEMTKVEDALMNLIGVYPYYMRPPFLSTNAQALSTLGSMGYHVVSVNIDTLDWQYDSTDPTKSEQLYQQQYEAGGTISLNHDPEPVTVHTVVPWIINYLKTKNMKSVTVGECLGDTEAGWYRTKAVSSTSSKAKSSTASSRASSSTSKRASSTSSAGPKSSSSVSSAGARSSSSAGSRSSSSAPGPRSSSSVASRSSSSVAPRSSTSAEGPVSSSSQGPRASSSPSGRRSSSSAGPRASSSPAGPHPSSSAGGPRASSSAGGPRASSPAGSKPSSAPAPGPSGKTSPNDTCGGKNGYVCGDGQCCSEYGYCGKTKDYCDVGCQPLFGKCTGGSSGGSDGGSTGGGKESPDGSCGGSTGFTCGAGKCCSPYGFCGTGPAYCSGGSDGGSTGGGSTPPSGHTSEDDTCGGKNGYVCGDGKCCSQYGYCGKSEAYCDNGCQGAFGSCW